MNIYLLDCVGIASSRSADPSSAVALVRRVEGALSEITPTAGFHFEIRNRGR